MNAKTEPTTQGGGIEGEIVALLERATASYLNSVDAETSEPRIELQVPRKPEHGDWASNVALRLAKTLKRKPIEIAEGIAAQIEDNTLIDPPEVLAPGFINLRVAAEAGARTIQDVLAEGDRFGTSDEYKGRRVLVEFVSANPTGPLHIGHGRNAVVGDVLARICEAGGFEVEREYYFNDAGVQMGLLGRSLRARYEQACGREATVPEEGYQGDYLKEIAAKLAEEKGNGPLEVEDNFFTDYAASAIMEEIRRDLATLGIAFDRYFSESSLHREGKVQGVLKRLEADGRVYEKEGALWLKTAEFGDEKDRVVRKSDGEVTYLAPDIAYHEDKFGRGFDRLMNVLGADHHSYVVRLKAAVQSLGHDAGRLHCVLIQMVGIKEKGVIKKLSTRAGDFTPLGEVLNELGPEIVRFFFLMRSPASQMVFDMDLAREQSMNNPYYYIQYAHARCCSLLKKAEAEGLAWRPGEPSGAERLIAPEERAIVFLLGRLRHAIGEAIAKDDPLSVVTYLRELATTFHSYFTAGNKAPELRCIRKDDPELTQARLTLIVALRQVLANGFRLLGLTPIERL